MAANCSDQNDRAGYVAARFVRMVAGAVTHLLLMWDNSAAVEGCVTFRQYVLRLGYLRCSCRGSPHSCNYAVRGLMIFFIYLFTCVFCITFDMHPVQIHWNSCNMLHDCARVL